MIGIFDSGMGGLSVARAIREQAPSVDLVYFGDIANMPYGTKDLETLERLTLRAMRLLRQEGATHLVSACNTASTSVIRPLLELFGMGESGLTEMVGPSVEYLRSVTAGLVVVVATPATVQSGVYQESLRAVGLEVQMIASPDLAPAIEFGAAENVVQEKVSVVVDEALRIGCDTLMMGSTHYALVSDVFQQELTRRGSSCTVFDPAQAVAKKALENARELGSGQTKFILSRDSTNFRRYVENHFPPNSYTFEIREEGHSPNVAA